MTSATQVKKRWQNIAKIIIKYKDLDRRVLQIIPVVCFILLGAADEWCQVEKLFQSLSNKTFWCTHLLLQVSQLHYKNYWHILFDQRLLNKPVSQLFFLLFRYTAEAERPNEVC